MTADELLAALSDLFGGKSLDELDMRELAIAATALSKIARMGNNAAGDLAKPIDEVAVILRWYLIVQFLPTAMPDFTGFLYQPFLMGRYGVMDGSGFVNNDFKIACERRFMCLNIERL